MSGPVKISDRLNEAIAHHNAGRIDRAEAIYAQLATVAPRNAIVAYLRGQVAEEQGRTADAMRLYRHACELDPALAACAVRLSQILVQAGRATEARALLRKAAETAPNSPELWNGLGYVAKVQGRLAEALACHQRALELNPRFTEALCQAGMTLGAAGQNVQALAFYDRARAPLDPTHAGVRYGRAQSLHRTYRTEEAVVEYDTFLRQHPGHVEARSCRLFALQGMASISREQLFAEHCAYGRAVGPGPSILPGYDLAPERRLRVAILSADLRTHSCAYFLEPLLRHLDPSAFEVCLYHDHFVEDATSARLREFAVIWRNFVGQSGAQVEKAIRADKPDILIDLSGHVAATVRLPLFAHRLAPVQITYLGYPDTTGVPAMDFRFTDAVADPTGEADAFATEQLVRFAPTAWAYQPPANAPAVQAPVNDGSRPITFGCFNSPTKFTPRLFAAWARLLAEVPNSRLLLKGRELEETAIREHLFARMRAQGMPVDRVELLARTTDTASHLEQYAQVDVALDTFPYNGTTTTCEALWMGRPVVTCRGERHASRVGASLLRAVGRAAWIAESSDDYVRTARDLANDAATRQAFAAAARDELRASMLLDHSGQSRRFAAALRECWRVRCAAMNTLRCTAAA